MTIERKVNQALDELKQDANFAYLLAMPLKYVASGNSCSRRIPRKGSDLILPEYREQFWTKQFDEQAIISPDATVEDIKNYIMALYFMVAILNTLVNKIISTGKVFTSAATGKNWTIPARQVDQFNWIIVNFSNAYIQFGVPMAFKLITDDCSEQLLFKINVCTTKPTKDFMNWPIDCMAYRGGHALVKYSCIEKPADFTFENIQKIVDAV